MLNDLARAMKALDGKTIAILFNDCAKHWYIKCDFQADLRSFAAPRVRSEQTPSGQFCECWEFRLLFKGQSIFFDDKLKTVHRFRLCRFPGGYYVFKPGRANRLDSHCAGGVRIFDAFPVQAVIYGRDHRAGTSTVMNWTFQVTCRSLGLKSGVMHLTCPSMIRVYDSDRSKDAVTLRPRYSSLNQYSFENMQRRGALVSRTCLAGMRKVTSHSNRNSIILASRFGRMFWTALKAGSRSGTCAAVGKPAVRLAY